MKTSKALLHALTVLGLCAGTPLSTAAAPACEEGQNLALYSEASASSCYGTGYEAQNAIDGSFQTRWATAVLIGPVWITIDLKGTKTFNCLDVYETPQYGGRIEEITVSISDVASTHSNSGATWSSPRCTAVGYCLMVTP